MSSAPLDLSLSRVEPSPPLKPSRAAGDSFNQQLKRSRENNNKSSESSERPSQPERAPETHRPHGKSQAEPAKEAPTEIENDENAAVEPAVAPEAVVETVAAPVAVATVVESVELVGGELVEEVAEAVVAETVETAQPAAVEGVETQTSSNVAVAAEVQQELPVQEETAAPEQQIAAEAVQVVKGGGDGQAEAETSEEELEETPIAEGAEAALPEKARSKKAKPAVAAPATPEAFQAVASDAPGKAYVLPAQQNIQLETEGKLAVESTSSDTSTATADGVSADPISQQPQQPAAAARARFSEALVGRAAAAADDVSLSPAQRGRFVNRVSRAIEVAGNGDGVVRLRLSPQALGALKMQVQISGGSLSATIEAESQTAKSLLLDNLPVLRERLASQNITIEQFDVNVPEREHQQPQAEQREQLPERERDSSDSNSQQQTNSENPDQKPSHDSRTLPGDKDSDGLNITV